jgi:hypothetical protein
MLAKRDGGALSFCCAKLFVGVARTPKMTHTAALKAVKRRKAAEFART